LCNLRPCGSLVGVPMLRWFLSLRGTKSCKDRAKSCNAAAELNVMTDGLINLQHIFAIVPCKPTVWQCCALG
jgi:hypothetical protein